MVYIDINHQETTMLEFIGLTAIVYLFLMGVMRLFRGKPPQREICIIREYEIKEDKEVHQQPEQFPEQQQIQPQRKSLPNNVVPINRKR
jgi:hypothetical protein